MNNFLKTTLITAVLSTGVMAGEDTGALPKTIESGAIVYVNKDISIASEMPVTIDNYGSIDTEITSSPYPKITGMDMREYGGGISTINNHIGRSVKEETDETNAEAIKDANAITDVTLEKVYKIVDEGGGTVNENLELENVEIAEIYDAELKAEDLATYTDKDLLYLGAEGPNRTVRIRGNQGVMGLGNAIECNLGNLGSENSYRLEFVEHVDIQGDISNYKNGSITVKKDGEKGTILSFRDNSKKELYIPITVGSGSVIFYGNANVYSEINVSNEGNITFGGNSTLKSKAILRIGESPTTTE